ncbi:MAG: TrbI/VirB10 family protein [Cytophagales bacterium]|nr:TrbI/VirB10 family protein [Cytophagales bacterium]
MAERHNNPEPTTRRNWLWVVMSIVLIVVAVLVGLRRCTGSTIQEKRAEAVAEKEAKALGQAAPGNADNYRRRMEEQAEKARQDAAKEPNNPNAGAAPANPASGQQAAGMPAGTPPTAQPGTGSANSTPTAGSLGKRIAGGVAQNATERTPEGAPSDEDLDKYDALKAQVSKDANRKLNVYEDTSTQRQAGNATSPAALLAAQFAQSQPQTTARTGAASTSNSNQSLLEAYLKQQQSGGAAQQATQDTRFLQNTAQSAKARAEQPPLVARSGVGRYALHEGTAINIIMERDVSSDLAGPCTARVERNVFDSVTQSDKLISASTRLNCEYNSEVVMGQERIMLAFTRMIFPETGASVWLADMKAADVQGAIGAPAEVNNRFWKIFGSSFLISWVASRAQSLQPTNVTINVGGSGGNTAAQVLSETSRQILQRNVNIKPELRLKAGDRLTVIVSRDMVLDPAVTGVR